MLFMNAHGLGLALISIFLMGAAKEKQAAYDLAQGCYSLENKATGAYLGKTANGHYRFAKGERLKVFMKPSDLGTYLMYDQDGVFFGRNGLMGLKGHHSANSKADWAIFAVDGEDSYSLGSLNHQARLRHRNGLPAMAVVDKKNAGGRVVDDRQVFRFLEEDMKSCAPFPEIALDATVSPEFYTKKDPKKPIVGFSDLHTHIGFPKAMNGLAMAGGVFHRYGVEHALEDCDKIHGKNGNKNLLELQYAEEGGSGYDTTGYPDFKYWPSRKTHTHIQAYYRWMQRAYLSGLKIIVSNVTGNPSFCQLLSIMNLKKEGGKCTGIDAVEQQTAYLYKLQDYIDAQEGGPGKGWLRIVKTPSEARAVIADNKLAMVLGVEHGTLFNCSGSNEACTESYIDEQLDRLEKMGIRSVFPIHRFDNDFGGTKLQEGSGGAWMHLTSKMSTSKIETITDLVRPDKLLNKEIEGYYYDVDQCPDGINGVSSIKSMREFMEKDFGGIVAAIKDLPVVGGVIDRSLHYAFLDKLEPTPEYELHQKDSRACNTRGLQPKGRHLIEGLMKKGFIIEGDHMSFATYMAVLGILEEANYSGFVSSHGWFENKAEIRKRIFALGGVITPFPNMPSLTKADILSQAKEMSEFKQFSSGMGIGSDVQGVALQALSDQGFKVNYPFKSIDGHVTFLSPKSGNRSFSYEKEGMAHYGLLAEWVHNLEKVDKASDEKFLHHFLNSAETYVQMWERAYAHGQAAKGLHSH